MLPSAFSALFSGETDPHIQRTIKDTKLLDGVFNAGLAPYNRFNGSDPFNDPANEEMMTNPRGIQKLVHVALQVCTQKSITAEILDSPLA